MKLHEHFVARMNLISRYDVGLLQINGARIAAPCIVAPGSIHSDWIADIDALDIAALEPLWPLDARIVLLGAAPPHAPALRAIRAQLATRNMALECMDLGAACRTYNVLAQEDRAVAALLFP
jgi:uncharacterized protein